MSKLNTLKAFLRLGRAPNTLTATSNVIAGWAVARATMQDSSSWTGPLIWAGLAAALLYAFGMMLNDLMDIEKDRKLAPSRPLPAGDISRSQAFLAMALCLCLALSLQSQTQYSFVQLANLLVLLGCVVAYNLLKETQPRLASFFMGSCRALCFLLGAQVILGDSLSAVWQDLCEHPGIVFAALSYLLLICLVTLLSRFEESQSSSMAGTRSLALVLGSTYLAPFVLSLTVEGAEWWPQIATLCGAVVLAYWVTKPALSTVDKVGLSIRNAVFGLVFFDALWCLSLGEWPAALVCASLFFFIQAAAKWIGQRGS